MARQNRRIDIGEDFYNLQLLHRAKSAASTTATYGSITGDIENQTDLKEKLDDLIVLAMLREE